MELKYADMKRLEAIRKSFEHVHDVFSGMSDETKEMAFNFHNENYSLNHCARWGLQSVEEILRECGKQEFSVNGVIFQMGDIQIECQSNDEAVELAYLMQKRKSDVRLCDECGRPMKEGFCIDSGRVNYCSEECKDINISPEEWNELYDDGEGDSYWTQWESFLINR